MLQLVLVLSFFHASNAFAEDKKGPSYFHRPNTQGLSRIEDNSFLLEEAYNQERGVVQFIQAFQWNKKARSFDYTFANEIPITDEKHQFSYTIPVSMNKDDSHSQGIGDVSLEYRTQWVKRRDEVLVATKFSLFTPIGSVKRGMGAGRYGVKANHAITSILSDFFVTHWNFGSTYYPQSENVEGGTNSTTSFNYGMSLFYMKSDTFNPFVELYAADDEVVNEAGDSHKVGSTRQHSFTVNPGMRWAINNEGGSQLVPGISFPYTLGTNGAESERGILLYCSFEDKYW
jgi:hypothetical protein